MRKLLKKHLLKSLRLKSKGAVIGIAMAMSVVLVSVASNLSFISMIEADYNQCQYYHDLIQEELLLRSDSKRMELWKENKKDFTVPTRVVEMKTQDRVRTYTLQYKETQNVTEGLLGFVTGDARTLKCLATAKMGARYDQRAEQSSAKRLVVRSLRNQTLAQYQYFTNTEMATNGDNVRFYGRDELYGPVHSNDDIYIRNLYGWPTFHGMVTTAKRIIDYSTGAPAEDSAPMDQIFLGGYEEEVGHIGFDPTAVDIRRNGRPGFDDPNIDIAYIKLQGGSYTSKLAFINDDGEREFVVYDIYPDQANFSRVSHWVGSPLKYVVGTMPDTTHVTIKNVITMKDTVWTNGPSGQIGNGASYFVDGKLWIEGKVQGRITFGAADSVFLTGDIYYANTEFGESPDNTDNPNHTDWLGIVSEKSISIKYKHRDPFEDGIKVAVNCNATFDQPSAMDNVQIPENNGGDLGGIVLYGAYAAIGRGNPDLYGDLNSFYEGVFNFEYQHPHGSTPNAAGTNPITNQQQELDHIDLHKYIYAFDGVVPPQFQAFIIHSNRPTGNPQVAGYYYGPNAEESLEGGRYSQANNGNPNVCHPEFSNPDNVLLYTRAPYGTDYPYYNPVWPEDKREIEFERGNIWIFGAVAQVRRGYVHRSGRDGRDHADQVWYDMEQFLYGGRHPSTGYNKRYYYDERLKYVQPPDFPQIYENWGNASLSNYQQGTWYYKVPSNW